MSNFCTKIKELKGITFDAVLDAAASEVPRENWDDSWKSLCSGKTVLEQERLLDRYFVAYGEMHRVKLLEFFRHTINARDFAVSGVSIVDWGCGQGLASAVLLDYLRASGVHVRVRASRLIEMSNAARERARIIVGKYDNVEDIRDVRWVENTPIDGAALDLPDGVPVIHLFSNILDVHEVNLKMVRKALDETRAFGPGIVVCVGIRKGFERTEAFWTMFGKPALVHSHNSSIRFAGRITTLKSCGCYGLSYRLSAKPRSVPGQPIVVPAEPVADKPQSPASQRKPVKDVAPMPLPKQDAPLPDRPGKYTRVFTPAFASSAIFKYVRKKQEWCAYEFSTPDDSLLYNINIDDVPPFYAVINNLIVRGHPTFAPLMVEEALSRVIGYTVASTTDPAVVRYRMGDKRPSNAEIVAALDAINPAKETLGQPEPVKRVQLLSVIPIMVARVQHAVMRGFMGGRFDGCGATIRVLAIERDVPCVRLALASLSEMFEKLSGLCRDGERAAGIVKFDVDVVALDREFDFIRDRNNYVAALDEKQKNVRYDAVLDVSFYHDSDSKDIFGELGFLPKYSARIKTAFRVSEKDCIFQICTSANIQYRPLLRTDGDGTVVEEPCIDSLRYFLRNVFRKTDFRDGQLPILNRALQGKSVIGLLPTGGGKSLTYQLATMMQPGIALVVDPLQSLMKDQVDGLKRNGIDACQYINATLKGAAAEEAIDRTISGNCKFIFISPERLSIPSYRRVLGEMYGNGLYFSYGVIDEVHCVSEWGHDFRPFYLHLGRNLHDFARVKDSIGEDGGSKKYIPLFGLTATASFDVLSDVQRELSGRNAEELESEAIVRYENTNRLELQYRVVKIANPNKKSFRDGVGVMQKRVDALDREIAEAQQKLKAGTLSAGERTLLRAKQQERDMHIEGAAGRSTLHSAQGKFREYAAACKLESIVGVIGEQEDLFKEALSPESIRTIKSKFLEREAIKEPSPQYSKVMGADLDVAFTNETWRKPVDPTKPIGGKNVYASGGLVFCPYKGDFVTAGGDHRGPSPISVESVYGKLSGLYGATVRHFTSSIKGNEEFERQRWESQQRFIDGTAGLMVATSAFGMGIDKPNIRFVVEVNHPVSLENFVQEAGRAGRDGKMAIATLLLSDASETDLSVSEEFHKRNFIGIRNEKKELVDLFAKRPMEREETSTAAEGEINGFLEELLSANIGDVRIIQVNVPVVEKKKRGEPSDKKDKVKDPKALLDKLIYRLCCIGVIDDVQCIYGDDDRGGSRYRLTMVRRADEDYYGELKKFLMRYYPAERASLEVERARDMRGENVIHKCVAYLTDFVYANIERKRDRAMRDMHAFCKEGCRPLGMHKEPGKPDRQETWLDINEDLKDWIYFYFNSKYARSPNVVKTKSGDEPFSLVDDTDHGKVSSMEIVKKYMRVVDDELLENNSPMDNVKHLQGAVRLIRRAALETNPSLSLLNVFCLCYLGFRGNDALVDECIRSLGADGFGLLVERGEIAPKEIWSAFDWFVSELKRITRRDELRQIVDEARLDIHISALKRLNESLA